ncbi:hypothetical protein TYRP_008481, partial [Tyrophagus putrescentiae]
KSRGDAVAPNSCYAYFDWILALSAEEVAHVIGCQSPIAYLSKLRLINSHWKLMVEKYLCQRLQTLTIEVDLSSCAIVKLGQAEGKVKVKTETSERTEKRIKRRPIYLTEAISLGMGALADDFELITETLDGCHPHRPPVLYQVLKGGPLIRLTGTDQLADLVYFLITIKQSIEVETMAVKSLSLVIIERDTESYLSEYMRRTNGPILFTTPEAMPIAMALLDQFGSLRQLVFTVFLDLVMKASHQFRRISDCLINNLIDTRVDGPLTSLDLNLNSFWPDGPEDFIDLEGLMPQLEHFGLNAIVTNDTWPALLTAASSRLRSLKMDVTYYAWDEELDEDLDCSDWEFPANPDIFTSVRSLCIISNCTNMCTLLMRYFTAVTSLTLADKGEVEERKNPQGYEPRKIIYNDFNGRELTMLAHLSSLDQSDVDRFTSPTTNRSVFAKQFPSLQEITFIGPLPSRAKNVEAEVREQVGVTGASAPLQIYLRSKN